MSPQRGELWLLVWVFSRSVSALQQTTVVRWFGSSGCAPFRPLGRGRSAPSDLDLTPINK